jgi:hypothetical protein
MTPIAIRVETPALRDVPGQNTSHQQEFFFA